MVSEQLIVIIFRCLAIVGIVWAGAWGCMNLSDGTGIVMVCLLAIIAASGIKIDFERQ